MSIDDHDDLPEIIMPPPPGDWAVAIDDDDEEEVSNAAREELVVLDADQDRCYGLKDAGRRRRDESPCPPSTKRSKGKAGEMAGMTKKGRSTTTVTLDKEDDNDEHYYSATEEAGGGAAGGRGRGSNSQRTAEVASRPSLTDVQCLGAPEVLDNADPITSTIQMVGSIFPNVDLTFVRQLYWKMMAAGRSDDIVQAICDYLMETKGKYPKIEPAKAQRAARASFSRSEMNIISTGSHTETATRKIAASSPSSSGGPNVTSHYFTFDLQNLPGTAYRDECMARLMHDFPTTPCTYLRQILGQYGYRYPPTYRSLSRTLASPPLPFKEIRARQYTLDPEVYMPQEKQLRQEVMYMRTWIDDGSRDADDCLITDAEMAARLLRKEMEESGADKEEELFECSCCFVDVAFKELTQCPDGHLVCRDCAKRGVEMKLTEGSLDLRCLSSTVECKRIFSPLELKRFLSEASFALYERLVGEESIRKAGLEDLEVCPFCPFAMIIENPDERLFRCDNWEGDCGKVSCRQCKKEEHLPRTCAEVEKEKYLDHKHVVEEAMTEALVRECPGCRKKFFKEDGCNKMSCSCGTISCYICRKQIKDYSHFKGNGSDSPKEGQCSLYDDTKKRHMEAIDAAQKKTTHQLLKTLEGVTHEDLKV